jgi:hypothetical protein
MATRPVTNKSALVRRYLAGHTSVSAVQIKRDLGKLGIAVHVGPRRAKRTRRETGPVLRGRGGRPPRKPAISELLAVVPPPEKPIEAGSPEVWAELQKEFLGVKLPDDLRDLGNAYGSGEFRWHNIRVFNPFSDRYNEQVNRTLEVLRDSSDVPYAVFPKSPGLFPVGSDDIVGSIYYLTKGRPNTWPIVLASHAGEYEVWNMPLSTLLARAMTKAIRCVTWPLEQHDLRFCRGRNQQECSAEFLEEQARPRRTTKQRRNTAKPSKRRRS